MLGYIGISKGSVKMVSVNQKQTNKIIELLFASLTKSVEVEKFTAIIQQNIDTKRLSATTEQDFFDRLMLNIAYFAENKKVWQKLMELLLTSEEKLTTTSIEAKALQEQMVVREEIATKMDDYKAIFHQQYITLNVTAEDVIYDYAYASVEHSLRFDFLSYVMLQKAEDKLKAGELMETIRIIDGYVAYFADQLVNQMELK